MAAPDRTRSLSPRQEQVGRLVARGLLDKEIARALGCGLSTVRNNLVLARSRLGLRNRVELARWFWDREHAR